MPTPRPTSSDLLSEYLLHTKDSTSANQTRGKQNIQHNYMFLLSEAKNYAIERTKTGSLISDQRSYLLPPDYISMKNVRAKSGDIWYPLTEVKSVERWHQMIGFEQTSNIPTHYIMFNEQGNLHLELDPVPNTTASESLELVYEGQQNPLLFPTNYTTGTISINLGEYELVGSGTTFTSAMVGQSVVPTNGKFWYEIKTFTDPTHLNLVHNFQETSISGSAFTIGEVLRLPPEFDYTPLWGACAEYYKPSDDKKSRQYEGWYARDLLILQDKYKTKSKGGVTPGRPVGARSSYVPRNYPTSALTL